MKKILITGVALVALGSAACAANPVEEFILQNYPSLPSPAECRASTSQACCIIQYLAAANRQENDRERDRLLKDGVEICHNRRQAVPPAHTEAWYDCMHHMYSPGGGNINWQINVGNYCAQFDR
jgi:hypothetical protein